MPWAQRALPTGSQVPGLALGPRSIFLGSRPTSLTGGACWPLVPAGRAPWLTLPPDHLRRAGWFPQERTGPWRQGNGGWQDPMGSCYYSCKCLSSLASASGYFFIHSICTAKYHFYGYYLKNKQKNRERKAPCFSVLGERNTLCLFYDGGDKVQSRWDPERSDPCCASIRTSKEPKASLAQAHMLHLGHRSERLSHLLKVT